MNATKKTLSVLCIFSLLLASFAMAQSSPATSDLVMAVESDGDLMDVAEAISDTGTDDLVATMSEGVTIFAPIDGSFDQEVLIEDVITDYIIPVMLSSSDMVTEGTFISMGGTPVSVTIFDDEIMVNGVPLVDVEGIYSGNVVVYKLSDSFDDTNVATSK